MSSIKAALPEKEIITHVKKLDGKSPGGDLHDKWSKYKSEMKLVNPLIKENITL